MEQQKYKYYAFISYKREDEKWAKWLQHKLEFYHIPTAVRKKNTNLPKRVRPIFKDTTDLCGGVLEKVINEALTSSQYLIVICSPRAAQSPWVCKEVQRFIDLGKEENIIPFIVEGTPFSDDARECYPEALRKLSGDREILGINVNENGRDAAAIKVVAHMFGLEFNTLWQRFRRTERRRRLSVVAGLIFLLSVVIAVAAYIYQRNLIIQDQNVRITAESKRANMERDRANTERDRANAASDSIRMHQRKLQTAYDSLRASQTALQQSNKSLAQANKNLNIANKKILEERDGMLMAQSRAVAEKIDQLIADGDIQTARALALEILPQNLKNPNRPYVPEAEIALRKTMFPPCYIYKQDVDSMVAIDGIQQDYNSTEERGAIYESWGSLRGSSILLGRYDNYIEYVINSGSTLVVFYDKHGFYLHDVSSGNESKLEGIPYNVDAMFFSKNEELLFAECMNGIYVWKIPEGQILDFISVEDESRIAKCKQYGLAFDENGGLKPFDIQQQRAPFLIKDFRIYARKEYTNEAFSKNKSVEPKKEIIAYYNEAYYNENEGKNQSCVYKYPDAYIITSNNVIEYFNFKTGERSRINIPISCEETECSENMGFRFILTIDKKLFVIALDTLYCHDLKHSNFVILQATGMSDGSLCGYNQQSNELLIINDKEEVCLYNIQKKEMRSYKVITPFTIGNAQEHIQEVFFLDSRRIMVIVWQGSHRILDIWTEKVIQYFDNEDYWQSSSHFFEISLPHFYVGSSSYAYIKSLEQLYVVSTGGVLRVYDINSGLCIQETELPIDDKTLSNARALNFVALEYSNISRDGKNIEYKIDGDDSVYRYKVQTLQSLLDRLRKDNKRILTKEEKRKYNLE